MNAPIRDEREQRLGYLRQCLREVERAADALHGMEESLLELGLLRLHDERQDARGALLDFASALTAEIAKLEGTHADGESA